MLQNFTIIPAVLWLLAPPVCVCHLPEQLLGKYREPASSERVLLDPSHAPGCPAARIHTPFESPDVDVDEPTPVVLPLVDGDAAVTAATPEAPSFWVTSGPPESSAGQDLYLILRAFRN